jgi:hypothetical protein
MIEQLHEEYPNTHEELKTRFEEMMAEVQYMTARLSVIAGQDYDATLEEAAAIFNEVFKTNAGLETFTYEPNAFQILDEVEKEWGIKPWDPEKQPITTDGIKNCLMDFFWRCLQVPGMHIDWVSIADSAKELLDDLKGTREPQVDYEALLSELGLIKPNQVVDPYSVEYGDNFAEYFQKTIKIFEAQGHVLRPQPASPNTSVTT